MAKRTILLITESTLGRFDLSGGTAPQVTESWVRPSFASQSAGTLVDAALRLGKSRKREVYVLTTRCWSGPVPIGSEFVSGASGDELKQMVALEGETYSGISAFESASSILALPPDALGDSRFWLTQIPNEDLRSLDEALRQAGARFAGVAHPAILSIDPSKTPTDEWRCLQNWDQTTFLMRGNGETIANFHSMSSGLQSQRTVQEFEEFFEGVECKSNLQWLGSGELPGSLSELPLSENHLRIDTETESDLQRWAAAWFRSQGRQSVGSPLITIPKRPMSKEAAIAISAVMGLLAIALCWGHHWSLKQRLDDAQANIKLMTGQQELLKAKSDQLKQTREDKGKALAEGREKMAEANTIRSQIADAQQVIDRGRRRWITLVDSLAADSDDDGWIREIQSTDGSVSIQGLAIKDSDVHQFAARLESAATAGLWEIMPATTKIDPETRLIEFGIDMIASGNSRSASRRPKK